MFTLRKPNEHQLSAWLLRQSAAEVFTQVGTIPQPAPRGFHLNTGRAVLGQGEATYRAACAALKQWEMFPNGWVEVLSQDQPAEVDLTVGVLARAFRVWSLNACRVVELSEQVTDKQHNFGFTYATVAGHVYRGAERFAVIWDHSTDEVRYELASYSKARHPFIWLMAPYVRHLQRRFATESAAKLLQALNARRQDKHNLSEVAAGE